MRVVLDTNVLLSCIAWKNPLRPIWSAFLNDEFFLIISVDIFFEYLEKLEQNTTPEVAANISELLGNSRRVVEVQRWRRWRLIHIDPDDNKFLDVAIAAEADYIVTDDKHFNFVKRLSFIKPKIITPEDFLQIINFKTL